MKHLNPNASCMPVNTTLRLLFSFLLVFLVACNPATESDDDENGETAEGENGEATETDDGSDNENGGDGETANGLIGDIDIFIGARDSRLIADGSDESLVRVTVLDSSGSSLADQELELSLSAGSLTVASGSTDDQGIFETSITAPDHLATGVLQVSSGGVTSEPIRIRYIAGPAVAENSVINVSPSSLPADGESETEVVVLLIDENGHSLPDGEEVTLNVSGGTIISDNPSVIDSGRASFTLRAPDFAGQAELSLRELGDLVGSVTFGAAAADDVPSSISTEVSHDQLYVTGLGQQDTSTLTVEINAADGNPLNEEDWEGEATVEIKFLTAPNGGEELLWTDSDGDLQSAAWGDAFEVSTTNGVAQLNLRTGSRPGIIEIKAEAVDPSGDEFDPPVTSIMQQVAVSSGPPHTIAVSLPNTNAVIDLNEATPSTPGFYRRRGGLTVTDRWGNTVPDGTVIQLGLIDTVIASNENVGETTTGSSELEISGIDLETESVNANGVQRNIEPGDRVLLPGALPDDKTRFVDEVINSTVLGVHKSFNNAEQNLDFLIGASLLGASIDGFSESGEKLLGHSITRDGLAEIAMTYPARTDTMFNRAWAVLSSSDSKATHIFDGLQFSAIAGFTLEATPSRLSGDGTIELVVKDGGDGMPLPDQPISYSISTDMADGAAVTVTEGSTGEDASFQSSVAITGAVSGDSATITYMAPDGAEAEVEITIP